MSNLQHLSVRWCVNLSDGSIPHLLSTTGLNYLCLSGKLYMHTYLAMTLFLSNMHFQNHKRVSKRIHRNDNLLYFVKL